jgi:hypothetical protein
MNMARYKQNTSANNLGKLNKGGTRLVKKALRAAFKNLKEADIGEPIRLLDIGCGGSPYLWPQRNTPPEILSVDLIDINKEAIDAHWMNASRKFDKDFFELVNDRSLYDRPFHIVVIAFALHELRAQLALHAIEPDVGQKIEGSNAEPAVIVLNELAKAAFIDENTVIILADVFHWRFWSADILERARIRQLEELDHADPPSAFLPGEEVVRHARCAGFDLIAYDETFSADRSHPLCADPDYGLIFRSRRAFCASLRLRPKEGGNGRSNRMTSTESSQCRPDLPEVIREGIAAKPEAQKRNHEYLQQLRALMESGRAIEPSDYDRILGRSLFSYLAQSAGSLAHDWFDATQTPSPESLAFWFGVNSLALKERVNERNLLVTDETPVSKWIGRYALTVDEVNNYKKLKKWLCYQEHLKRNSPRPEDPGDDQEWSSLCYNAFNSIDAIELLTEEYTWLKHLDPPSIYRWMTTLGKDNPAWRSISIVVMPTVDPKAPEAPAYLVEDALVLHKYSPHSMADEELEGHTLIALSGDLDVNVVHSLGERLDQLSLGNYCQEKNYKGPHRKVRLAVLHALSAIYLDAIFLSRGQRHKEPSTLEALLDGFEGRWLKHPFVRFFDASTDPLEVAGWLDGPDKVLPLPVSVRDQLENFTHQAKDYLQQQRYLPAVWTCFIVKQPGSDTDPIATIMILSDRPCDPALLELFTAQFEEVFFSIREVEAERSVRQHASAEAKARTTQSMLGSLGHDGKRPAELIRQVVHSSTGLTPEQRITTADSIAEGLVGRLSGYTRLIDDGSPPEQKHKAAWKEGRRVSESCHIKEIWEFELALTLLRLAVDNSGKWSVIRRNLGMTNIIGQVVDAYPNLRKILTVLDGKISCDFEGPNLVTPKKLSSNLTGKGGTTDPRVFHALHFLFAEFITNAFRHEYPEANARQLNLTLVGEVSVNGENHVESPLTPVLANFSCIMQPAHPENHEDMITSSTHGLDSLANVARSIGASVGTRSVTFYNAETDERRQITPGAFFQRKNRTIVWDLCNVPCFLGG